MPGKLRRYFFLIGPGFFVLTLLRPERGIGLLPLQFLLKQQLHFTPLDMAKFFAIAATSWYLKPLAGMLSDHFPILGSRRHVYMMAGSLSVTLLWLLIGFGPHTRYALLGAVTALTTMFTICQATMSGLVVEGGRQFAATGRLSSARRVAEFVSALLVGPIGGWLASRPLQLTGTACAAVALALTILLIRYRTDQGDKSPPASWTELRTGLRTMAASKPMWAAATLFFLLSFSPGFQTPLFYYKTNTLHFSAQFIGMLALVSAAGSIVASASYAWACSKVSLRTLMALGVILDAAAQGLYVFYASPTSAVVIEATAGLMRGFVWMPILDLLVRAVPKGNEAAGAALEWAPANVAVAVSDLAGSWLYQQYGLSFKNLAWLNSGTTLMILFIVPLIPASLIAIREGQAPE
jgi:predicted MFS family arabinose efflux permease